MKFSRLRGIESNDCLAASKNALNELYRNPAMNVSPIIGKFRLINHLKISFNLHRILKSACLMQLILFCCSFPKDEKVLNKWIVAIRRKNWTPSKRSKLCSAHFTADSYETSGWSSRPRLKPDAVPTIFDFPVHPTKTERETQLQSLRESLFSTMSGDAILN